MKCPVCGKGSAYECDNCGELRCNASACPGTEGKHERSAGNNTPCPTCRKGIMKRLK